MFALMAKDPSVQIECRNSTGMEGIDFSSFRRLTVYGLPSIQFAGYSGYNILCFIKVYCGGIVNPYCFSPIGHLHDK